MKSQNKVKILIFASLLVLLSACYTQRLADTEYFKGTARLTRFGVKYIPNSGSMDTVYHGMIKLKETGKATRVYNFKSTLKTYEKKRYFVIHFGDKNDNFIAPGVLFDIGQNGLVMGQYATLVIINTKIKDSKMTKAAILEVIVTWLNRDRYK